MCIRDRSLTLGSPPEHPVNEFRAGEKILLNGMLPNDFTASVTMNFNRVREGRGSGILFRSTAPSVGFDAARGYFVGIKPSQNTVLLGKMDGSTWQELTRRAVTVDVSRDHQLSVSAEGSRFTVSLNGSLLFTHQDGTYKSGTLGLRVTDIPTTFSNLRITASP